MDMALEELWKKFHLSEEEKGVLAVSSQEVASSREHAQFNILFKLQATKEFNKKAFKSTTQKLWCGSQGVTIKEVGKNLFLAIFVNREDMMDVLDRSPWSFDRKLILLKRFNGDISPSSVSFQYSPFWIRVFNIPIKSMNTTVGNRIAKEIGVPLVIDAPKSGLAWGPFLRILVDVDITKPLIRGKMIHIEEMEDVWVYFKYERLPTFCYRCGILGHQDCDCQGINKGYFHTNDDVLEFGPWLQAVAPKTKYKKGNSNTHGYSDVETEDTFLSNEEDDTVGGDKL
ncbi:uncharacterized protein LOC115967129 [Quercus lobata]|uniref:uncharacterized protein LOC115967129 n=1 Tax=Quercus lobata TaxID=97700 RepID=UPI0012469580|nr:uncharacterized protein LOC115967129 [Quercus lobata]